MYIIKDHQGNIVAIASRKEDALAMTMTVGKEPARTISTK